MGHCELHIGNIVWIEGIAYFVGHDLSNGEFRVSSPVKKWRMYKDNTSIRGETLNNTYTITEIVSITSMGSSLKRILWAVFNTKISNVVSLVPLNKYKITRI